MGRRREKGVVRGSLCQRNGSNLEYRNSRRPRVLVVYRTLMKMRFQREIKYTGVRGRKSSTRSELTQVSREMCLLIVGRQAKETDRSQGIGG